MMGVPFRRVFSACLAFWFALSSVDPGWLHACPMHGRGAVQSADAHAGMDHAVGSDNASHHAHTTAPTDQSSNGSHDPSHNSHQCLCLGVCHSGTSGIATDEPFSLTFARIVAAPEQTLEPLVSVLVQREAFVLPFATAPPNRAS